ncbi:hypothetical protein DPMN_069880 [Dreissena polymorpha]|uniref:Uncharacterized protein n=1 Tax=Dreissena polymorpha TaxID=45954 RepID=A0A9D4BNG9_DREPO|nr:hypothetical protein DPMN_069880 [Dreissena polymorpha]
MMPVGLPKDGSNNSGGAFCSIPRDSQFSPWQGRIPPPPWPPVNVDLFFSAIKTCLRTSWDLTAEFEANVLINYTRSSPGVLHPTVFLAAGGAIQEKPC